MIEYKALNTNIAVKIETLTTNETEARKANEPDLTTYIVTECRQLPNGKYIEVELAGKCRIIEGKKRLEEYITEMREAYNISPDKPLDKNRVQYR